MSSSAIEKILSQLVSGFGHDVVEKACLNFTKKSKSSSDSEDESDHSSKKEKKQRSSRGPNSWTIYIGEVQAELQAAAGPDTKITRKMAMAEAGRRKRAEAGPEAEEKYQAAKAKKAEKKSEKKNSDSEEDKKDSEKEEKPHEESSNKVSKKVKKHE